MKRLGHGVSKIDSTITFDFVVKIFKGLTPAPPQGWQSGGWFRRAALQYRRRPPWLSRTRARSPPHCSLPWRLAGTSWSALISQNVLIKWFDEGS